MPFQCNNITCIGKKCCGCRACEQICPVSAITFLADKEGFMQPFVNENTCVNCGKCLSICPINHVIVYSKSQTGYAAKTKSTEDLKNSSSGGLFYVMAKYILKEGGVVCGCSNDDNLMPNHVITSTIEGVKAMRGSKYVQSNLDGVFSQLRSYLTQGTIVLFTGVPCQVAGLRNFLGKDYPNLYCVDIICHGVPSRELYAKYLRWLENKWNGRVTSIDFRSKKRHLWSLTLRVRIHSNNHREKEHLLMGSLDPYYYNFLQGNTYRESCYTCVYAQDHRPGDITIGDFWGIEHTHPELFDINGVSCALVNSDQGRAFWDRIAPQLSFEEVIPQDIIRYNGNLREPTRRPAIRDSIYKEVEISGFDNIPYELPIKARIIDTLKNLIPNRIRIGLKMKINLLRSIL